jgi:(p)ppGpp synthase/HD superfamily hydrolase
VATPHIRLGPRFVEAVAWVTELHADQARKGGSDVPYLSHLLAVAALVLEDGGGELDAIVALCHDAVEDQGGEAALAEVRRRFGDEVADAVDLLSDSHGHHGEDKAPWMERKARLLAQLGGPEVPEAVLRVAAADKLHNARTILVALEVEGTRVWERFRSTPPELVWFYRSVATVLADRHPGSTNVAELERAVDQLATWVDEGQVRRPA